MTTSSHIGQSIRLARNYLTEHPEAARYPDSAASAVVEDGLRCRVEGPGGAVMYTDMPARVGGELAHTVWIDRANGAVFADARSRGLAVDLTGARVHDAQRRRVMPALLEEGELRDGIRVQIRDRISHAVDVAHLAREVEGEVRGLDQRAHQRRVRDVSDDDGDGVLAAQVGAVAAVALGQRVDHGKRNRG